MTVLFLIKTFSRVLNLDLLFDATKCLDCYWFLSLYWEVLGVVTQELAVS
jgi:hypothetical protein